MQLSNIVTRADRGIYTIRLKLANTEIAIIKETQSSTQQRGHEISTDKRLVIKIKCTQTNTTELRCGFSETDTTAAIKELNIGKAAGLERIYPEFLWVNALQSG